jgi:N-acetylneuraminic acid mutarotase
MNMLKGRWQTLPDLAEARSHAPIIPYQGRLYVFGGGGPDFKSSNSVVYYDPSNNTWRHCADMPTKRSGSAAFLIDDKIYVVGGGYKKPDGNFQFLKTVEIYDPATDSWSAGPDMLQPHDYPAAVEDNGRIYILGGHHPDACLGGPKTDPGFSFCEHWAPGEDGWQTIADLPTPRFAASGFMRDDKIMVAGGVAFRPEGFDNFDFIESYDKNSGQWQQEEQLKLPWPAAGQGMYVVDDALFFFGGYSTENIHERAAILLPGETEWTALPEMPIARCAMGVALLGQTLYLVGGWADDGRTPMNSVIAYTMEP